MLNNDIIISGASSKSGFHFLKILSSLRFRKKIFVIHRKKKNKILFRNLNLKIIFIQSDINHLKFKKLKFDDPIFVHIAGIYHSLEVVNFCKKNRVKKIITIHTSGMFSSYKPESVTYKKIDKIFKNQCNLFKINYTILYPTLIYGTEDDGNISKLIKYMKKNFIVPIFGTGKNYFQPIYYKDLSKAIYLILINSDRCLKNKEYILAGKTPIQYINLLKEIKTIIKSKNFFFYLPISISIIMTDFLSFFFKLPINKYFILRMRENRSFSNSKAIKDFGFKPKSFKDGARLQIKRYFS